tara:strand:- start:53 stop:292 length:240 start_codon:yes stop_codon:yes gene_type:complete
VFINNVIISYYYLIGVSQENLIMSKEKNKANDNKVSDKLNKANDLKAWQDGSLVNDKALKRLSLKELNELNDMLSRAGY